MRPAEEIRDEVDELAARRCAAWRRLGAGDVSAREEIAALTERIDELWLELRETTLRRSFGPRERILARARAHERFDRELRRSLKTRSQPPAQRGQR